MILAVLISLVMSTPIAGFVNSLLDGMYMGVYINTAITLITTTTIITIFVHLIVVKPLNKIVEVTKKASQGDLNCPG